MKNKALKKYLKTREIIRNFIKKVKNVKNNYKINEYI